LNSCRFRSTPWKPSAGIPLFPGHATPTPAPTPDPAEAAFAKIEPLLASKSTAARDSLRKFLVLHPLSPPAPRVRQALGAINIALLKDPAAWPESVYTVKPGDSLVRIASRQGGNAELIFWANDLPNFNIRPGQQLVIPSIEPSLALDRTTSSLVLYDNGAFFKEYPLVSLALNTGTPSDPFETTIRDRIALKDATPVAFGHKDYPQTERFIRLDSAAIDIRPARPAAEPTPADAPEPTDSAQPTPEPATTADDQPKGIVLSQPDFNELWVLVKRGTPVAISEAP
jgi:hypothetical protein